MKILVTGCAGFIGFHLSKFLTSRFHEVYGLDVVNDYYDVKLKKTRLKQLRKLENFTFTKHDLCDRKFVEKYMHEHQFDIVIHLAAQAGVRYSLENPQAYVDSNLVAFQNVIDSSVATDVKQFIYASSSSVYGGCPANVFNEDLQVDTPISLYAATKKANELVAHSYSHIYGLQTVGLRFFTVYGPWGRPDMAMWIFTKAIYENKEIEVFNHGDMYRDFTYIDDIVSGIDGCINNKKLGKYNVFNLGNNKTERLMDMIGYIEQATGKTAKKRFEPLQAGDVVSTSADITRAKFQLGFEPKTTINEGIPKFVNWYKDYHNIRE